MTAPVPSPYAHIGVHESVCAACEGDGRHQITPGEFETCTHCDGSGKRPRPDVFLHDTEAASLDLYLEPARAARNPDERTYRVKRHGIKLFEGDRVQVRVWLRGYAAAMAHPAIEELSNQIQEITNRVDCATLLHHALQVADLPAGSVE